MTTTWVIGDTGIGEATVRALNRLNSPRYDAIHVTGIGAVDACSVVEVGEWIESMPHFDEIVYAAGLNQLTPIGSIDMRNAVDVFYSNVFGFVNVLNQLHKRDFTLHRSIVAVGSDAARTPMRHSIAYCASKAAIVQAVRVAARELAPLWRINCVSPAAVAGTPMSDYIDASVQELRGWSPEEAAAYELKSIPMGRRSTTEEVADTIVSVLRGAEFMTGSNVEITGGK